MKIAVILPSRGLIFSQTVDEILQNLKGIPHKFFFSHRLPLPRAFEKPTCRAIFDEEITHLWFVEEDMVLPPDTLRQMLELDANAVTCDYPINNEGMGSVFKDQGGQVVFCGTGCLLIKRSVFDNLNAPYFTDKIRWRMLNYGESVKLEALKSQDEGYGLHDITFCVKLWNNGVLIKVLPIKLGQRRLVSLGKSGSNDGAHNIEVWTKIIKDKRLKTIQSQPIAPGAKTKLVIVDTPTGGVTTSQKHAATLVKQGLATYPPRMHTIIDDSDVKI